jgi:nitroreductase
MAMEFEEVIRKRRMIREFDPNKQIPEKILGKLLRNAHRAPSAGHTEAYRWYQYKGVTNFGNNAGNPE